MVRTVSGQPGLKCLLAGIPLVLSPFRSISNGFLPASKGMETLRLAVRRAVGPHSVCYTKKISLVETVTITQSLYESGSFGCTDNLNGVSRNLRRFFRNAGFWRYVFFKPPPSINVHSPFLSLHYIKTGVLSGTRDRDSAQRGSAFELRNNL